MLLLFLRDFKAAIKIQIVGPQFIARDLLLYKTVERLVLIELLNDVVAVAPGIGKIDIRFETARIRVAYDV